MAIDHPPSTSPSTRSSGTSTSSKKTSQNSAGSVHRLDRPHGDAGAVHVDEERGDAPVCRLGRPGPRQEDAALGVLRQAGPHLLAVDPPAVVRLRGPAGQRAEVAPGARLGEPLAPDLVAAQQPRHHRRPPGPAVRSRSLSAPAPRAWSRCPARRGHARSAPRRGRPAGGWSRRDRRRVRASPSA